MLRLAKNSALLLLFATVLITLAMMLQEDDLDRRTLAWLYESPDVVVTSPGKTALQKTFWDSMTSWRYRTRKALNEREWYDNMQRYEITPEDAIRVFVANRDGTLVHATLSALEMTSSDQLTSMAMMMLYHPDASIRKEAVSWVASYDFTQYEHVLLHMKHHDPSPLVQQEVLMTELLRAETGAKNGTGPNH